MKKETKPVKEAGGEEMVYLFVARDADVIVFERHVKKAIETVNFKADIDEILNTYDGSIIFKVNSNDKTYSFQYSLDNSKSFNLLAQVDSNKILSKGYTGAYLGLYATTNGQDFQEYADFDWVTLK